MVLTNCHVLGLNESGYCPADGVGWKYKDSSRTSFHVFYEQSSGKCIGRAERANNDGTATFNDWGLINVDCAEWNYDSAIIGNIGTISEVGRLTGVSNVKFFEHALANPGVVRLGVTGSIAPPPQDRYFSFGSDPPGQLIASTGDSGSVIVETMTNKAVGLLDSGNGKTADAQQLFYVLSDADARLYDPKTNPVSFFRYVEQNQTGRIGYHRYTPDWGELTTGEGTPWAFEHREGAIFKAQPANPDPKTGVSFLALHYYASRTNHDYLYTTSMEHGEGDDEYCYLGAVGYVPEKEIPLKTVKLYRYFRDGQHFYSTDPAEAARLGFEKSDIAEDGYWVFGQDGPPDPPTLYQGPADARVALDPSCSYADVTVQGKTGRTAVSGNIDLTIGPDCHDPICALTLASLDLRGVDFSIGKTTVSQVGIRNVGYALGAWNPDTSFVLPDLSTTVQVKFALGGIPLEFINTNNVGPLRGILPRDYSRFDLSGDFQNANGALHLNLCGRAIAHPPTAVLTPRGPFQCVSPAGAHVTFSSELSSDPDGDIAHRLWRVDNVDRAIDTPTLTTTLSLGSHLVSVAVADSRGATSTASEKVLVEDTAPPTLTVSVPQTCLWPPNHNFALYRLGSEITTHTTDTCDSQPTVRIVSVTSNQAPLGGGSGNTNPDIKFGSTALCVRAERAGTLQSPREYTVTLESADRVGNKTTKQFTIVVPDDQSGTSCGSQSVALVGDDDARCTQ